MEKMYNSNSKIYLKANSYKLKANQKGSAIFLVILILAGVLTVTIGINNLVLKGIKFSRNVSWSAPAYFAAETGIEKALYQIRKNDNDSGNIPTEEDINGNFDLGTETNQQIAKWEIGFKCSDVPEKSCAGENIASLPEGTKLIIKSTGTFKNVNRSIELNFCIKGTCP